MTDGEIADRLQAVQQSASEAVNIAKVNQAVLIRVEEHIKTTNGIVAALKEEHLQMRGGMSVLRWLFGAMLAIVSVGAGVAGIVLAIVAQQGV